MTDRRIVVVFSGLFLVILVGFIQRRSTTEYCDRGDRMEGIKKFQPHGGAYIDLLGVRLDGGAYVDLLGVRRNGSPIPSIDSLQSLQLRFYLPGSIRMKIKVKDLIDKNYEMTPHRQFWKNDWNSFTWPTDAVLRKIPIQIQELVVSDSIYSNHSDFVVPYLLTGENAGVKRQNYIFIFTASGRAEITAKWFQKNNQYYEEIEKEDLDQPASTPFPVEREFTAADREGYYRLQLRGRVRKLNRIEPVNREYDFYHKPLLLLGGAR